MLSESLKLLDRAIEQAEDEILDLVCKCGRKLTVGDVNGPVRGCGECSTRITVIVGGYTYS